MGVCLLAFVMLFGTVGCTTEKLDAPNEQKTADSEDWMEDEKEPSDEKQKEDEKKKDEASEDDEISAEDDEMSAEDDSLSVDSVEDEDIDYAKYQEKESTVSGVTYSTGGRTNQDEYQTDPVPEGKQEPVEPGSISVDKSKTYYCYLTIACHTILDNMDNLTEGKENLVPSDGIIYKRRKVSFNPGESVFDILKRETRNNRIHMEFRDTPIYNSAYVSGIHNLYEFDCGQDSGWMFCVNGWYPNYGCSRYVVQNGDEIEWNYTCDLGEDLGQSWMD